MKPHGRSILAGLALVLAMALMLPPAASAKLPPSGKYGCVLVTPSIEEPDQYLGDLKIKGNQYKINRSAWGTMTNPSAKKIHFKTGAWKGLFRGHWERGKSSYEPSGFFVEIELTEIETGFESSYCNKES
jgi:hypothetical protein